MNELGTWKANIFETEAATYRSRGYNIGAPQATESLSADVLAAHGMVGIYLPEGATDPKLEHGDLYFEDTGPEAPKPASPKQDRQLRRPRGRQEG